MIVRQQTDRRLGLGLGAVWVASVLTVLVAYPAGAPVSSDPGAPAIPVWVTVLPALVGIGLALLLPPRGETLAATVVRTDRLRVTTGILVACAVALPVAAALVPLEGEDYIVGKAVLLMAIPAFAVPGLRRAVRFSAPQAAWRWWAPALCVAAWTLLSQVAPWVPEHDLGDYSTEMLVVGGIATAITAGLGEELFYRRWLQTRLEALVGPWTGLGFATLAFALMHLGSHGTGAPWLDVARVIALQGSFGLLMGLLWWSYRNLALIVVAHLIANGWGLLGELIGRATGPTMG